MGCYKLVNKSTVHGLGWSPRDFAYSYQSELHPLSFPFLTLPYLLLHGHYPPFTPVDIGGEGLQKLNGEILYSLCPKM
jgi:hypothetical protein